MKLEIFVPDDLLTSMSEEEIKTKIEDFIKELSFEQKLKLISLQLKSAFPDEADYWREVREAKRKAWDIYERVFGF